MQWEKSDMTLPKFVRAQLRRKNIALLTHNEKHVGQIIIITIPKHIHSNYFPLIFWVISNDILTTTNITITQKHCRDDIFQKPTWITYFRSTLKKKKTTSWIFSQIPTSSIHSRFPLEFQDYFVYEISFVESQQEQI